MILQKVNNPSSVFYRNAHLFSRKYYNIDSEKQFNENFDVYVLCEDTSSPPVASILCLSKSFTQLLAFSGWLSFNDNDSLVIAKLTISKDYMDIESQKLVLTEVGAALTQEHPNVKIVCDSIFRKNFGEHAINSLYNSNVKLV